MSIYAAGVLVSIVVFVLIGAYAGMKVKGIDDYYVCGRNAPTLFITCTLFASMLSTNGFMGDTAFSYGGNITTMLLLNTLCAGGYVIGGLFFGRYIRRAMVNTMPTYFSHRFNSFRIRRLAAMITVASLFAYLISVLQGTGLLMETLTGYSRVTCLLIAWVGITLFTFYSGARGSVLTDTVMCLFFLGITIFAGPYVFEAAGGLENLLDTLARNPETPPGLLDYHGNPRGGSEFDMVFYGITMGIIWLVTVAVSPWQAGRNLMARNEHVILRSSVMMALLTVIFLLYLYLMSISVIPVNPAMDQPEKVMIWAAMELMPPLVGVALLAGILTAGLTSACTFLSVVGFSLSSDILNIKFASEKSQLRFTRGMMLLVSLLSLMIASMDMASIRVIAWFASTIIAASWGYVAFASVWSKKLTERGAYLAMAGGFFGYMVAKLLKELAGVPLVNLFDPFFIGVAISIVLGIWGSKGQTKTIEEITYQDKIHQIPASETVAAEYVRSRYYGWIMVVAGVLVSTFLIYYWAIPYNALISQ